MPEMWDDGIDDWTSVYERRLKTRLYAMEDIEKNAETGHLRSLPI